MKTNFVYLLAATVWMTTWATSGRAAGLPEDVQRYASAMQSDLRKLIQSDASLAREVGETKTLVLDFNQAFLMKRVDPALLQTGTASQATISTGIYYVPLCRGSSCPAMAAFTRDEKGAPDFVSVGQPNLTQQLRETRDRLRQDPSLDPNSLQAVQYNEARANFFLAQKADGSGEVWVAQSPAEEQALLTALGRPAADKDAGGRPRFSTVDLRSIAREVERNGEAELLPPDSALSDPSDFHGDKPLNRKGLSAQTESASVVLALDNGQAPSAALQAAAAPTARELDSPAESTSSAPGIIGGAPPETPGWALWGSLAVIATLAALGWLIARRA